MLLLESLHPPGPPATVPDLLARVRPHERAGAARPFTYLNMVASADGRAAVDGSTSALGDEADLAVLLELRTIADAVLIGSGTLRAEGYDRLIKAPDRRARRTAAGLAEDPIAVVISRRLDLPWDAGLFAAAGQPVLIYTAAAAATPPEGLAADVEVVRLEAASPGAVLADLRARGVRALLSESGPTTNRLLLESGLADELFLTLAPLLTGDETEPTIVAGPRLPAPAPLNLQWILRHGDELFLRYAVGAPRG